MYTQCYGMMLHRRATFYLRSGITDSQRTLAQQLGVCLVRWGNCGLVWEWKVTFTSQFE